MPFVRELPVRFPDVDFARVVYYPRFFDYCHRVFEDFFAAEVGTPYARMLQDRKVGYPTVHASADFKSPLRFGDVVRIELTCENVGERSITSRYRLSALPRASPASPEGLSHHVGEVVASAHEASGKASADFARHATILARGRSGAACAELKIVVVPVHMDTFTGLEVPDDVRAAFERFR